MTEEMLCRWDETLARLSALERKVREMEATLRVYCAGVEIASSYSGAVVRVKTEDPSPERPGAPRIEKQDGSYLQPLEGTEIAATGQPDALAVNREDSGCPVCSAWAPRANETREGAHASSCPVRDVVLKGVR